MYKNQTEYLKYTTQYKIILNNQLTGAFTYN